MKLTNALKLAEQTFFESIVNNMPTRADDNTTQKHILKLIKMTRLLNNDYDTLIAAYRSNDMLQDDFKDAEDFKAAKAIDLKNDEILKQIEPILRNLLNNCHEIYKIADRDSYLVGRHEK